VVAVRDLATRIPADLRAELAAAAAVLAAAGPAVVAALETLGRATTEADWAAQVPASLDPAELAGVTDDEWADVEETTGIANGWRWADRIRNAHPDYADGVR
jgi:hypothetical protein